MIGCYIPSSDLYLSSYAVSTSSLPISLTQLNATHRLVTVLLVSQATNTEASRSDSIALIISAQSIGQSHTLSSISRTSFEWVEPSPWPLWPSAPHPSTSLPPAIHPPNLHLVPLALLSLSTLITCRCLHLPALCCLMNVLPCLTTMMFKPDCPPDVSIISVIIGTRATFGPVGKP